MGLSKKAERVAIGELERGDIVIYVDQVTQRHLRGIVYNKIVSSREPDKIIGLRLLPALTIGARMGRTGELPFAEDTQPSVVLQMGGTPGRHKAIIVFDIKTVANRPGVTGVDKPGFVTRIGSLSTHPVLADIYGSIENLYTEGRLYMDGKPLTADKKINIVPRRAADMARELDRRGRAEARGKMGAEPPLPPDQKPLGAQIKSQIQSMPLKSARDKGYISERTYGFITDPALKPSGGIPKTLSDAYALVTENPERLTKVFGLGSKGKTYQGVIADVKQALEPKNP